MKSKNFLFVLLAGLLSLFACTSTSVRQPAAAGRGRHVIVTLHGVRGTDVTYGHFHPIVKAHLEKVDPGYQVIAVNFLYPTGKEDYDPNNVTKSINERILKELDGRLDPTDKISVLGYSMGGQVMGHWYLNTMFDPNTAQIAKQTKNLIGLGAPYWGSNAAWYGLDHINDAIMGASVSKIGMSMAETKSLSTLSTSTSLLRQKMMIWAQNPQLKETYKPNILSIAGIMPCQFKVNPNQPGCGGFRNKLAAKTNDLFKATMFSGLVRWETDGAVIIPSARLDFLFYKDGNEKPATVESSQFVDIQSGLKTSFKTAETWHAGFEEKLSDVVIIEKSCWEPSKCQHRAYKYIFEALAACTEPGNSCVKNEYDLMISQLFPPQHPDSDGRAEADYADRIVQGELQGFFLELSLKPPENFQLKEQINAESIFKYIRFNFANKDFKTGSMNIRSWNPLDTGRVLTGQNIEFEVGRGLEPTSRMVKFVTDKNKNIVEIKIAVMGRFAPAPNYDVTKYDQRQAFVNSIWKGQTLPFEVHIPGLQPRKINAVVKPTVTTFVDLTLKK